MSRKLVLMLVLIMPLFGQAQQLCHTDSVAPPATYDNIFVSPVSSDSLSSSFIIFIKKEVPMHFHAKHTEQVYVLEGTGLMQLGKEKLKIKSGDLICIPAGTKHNLKVTSDTPVKVISIQSPHFDGTDRIAVKDKPE